MEHELMRELSAAYALHALDPDDEQLFEQHLRTCEECRAAVAGFESTADQLAAAASPATPRPGLRARILETVARDREVRARPFRARGFQLAAATAAVSTAAAIGLGVWAASLSHDLGRERQGAKVVALSGADGSVVLTDDREAVLVVRNLEPAPDGRTYEAWVISDGVAQPAGVFSGGSPRVAVALTRRVPAGTAVAVTIEPAGGSKVPTSSPIFRTARL